MKKFFLYPISVVLLVMCSCQRREFKHGLRLEKNLYVEFYSAGLTGSLTSLYLTDSANFRLYAGTYDDENELLHIRRDRDSIIIVKRVTDTLNDRTRPNRNTYSLKALEAEHLFE
ncbi:MAG: hypothetical protein EOO61_20545 [Hymenobacter sp.]|nr:MAG: hypothetical protein EOO61_20545 [Hymenobacter sp.]